MVRNNDNDIISANNADGSNLYNMIMIVNIMITTRTMIFEIITIVLLLLEIVMMVRAIIW